MNNDTTPPDNSRTKVRFSGLPSSKKWLSLVQSFLQGMKKQARVEHADVKLEHSSEASPGYTASVHLQVPGPDLKAEHRGATLQEAWQKVCATVMNRIRERDAKRAASRKRTEPRRALCT